MLAADEVVITGVGSRCWMSVLQ